MHRMVRSVIGFVNLKRCLKHNVLIIIRKTLIVKPFQDSFSVNGRWKFFPALEFNQFFEFGQQICGDFRLEFLTFKSILTNVYSTLRQFFQFCDKSSFEKNLYCKKN